MNKKPPERMCIVCREMIDKKNLTRIVKNKNGEFNVDLSGKLPGRGAYVCTKAQCLEKLKKTKVLNKAFKCMVPEQIYIEVEKLCKEKN